MQKRKDDVPGKYVKLQRNLKQKYPEREKNNEPLMYNQKPGIDYIYSISVTAIIGLIVASLYYYASMA